MCLAFTSQSSSSSSSCVVGCGSRGLPRWKRHEWRKQPARASLVPPRKTAEDDHDDEDDWDATLNRHD